MRYDNEAGKGNHKHIGDKEVGISFESLEGLLSDFWGDVNNMKR
ncbi:toxin-antitoxin system TumE family protein [Pseudomonas graminis]